MNEILRTIEERRSIKKFKSDMPRREDIDAILKAGSEAASGRNRQASVMIAISDPVLRNKLSKANASILGADTDPFYNAPVVIVVLARKDVNTYIYDGSLSLGNMMLAAHSLGLGACWVHRAKETFEMPEWQELVKSLGLEGEYEGIGNLALGYADCEYPAKKERLEGRIFSI